MRGRVVALEGVDGAGKTLQAETLAARLRAAGRRVRVVREPGGTATGEELRRILLAREPQDRDPLLEVLLFSASRRALAREVLAPARAAGDFVVLDRSFLSTWVYQGRAGGVDVDWILALSRRVLGQAGWPDRILWLRLPPEVAARRRAGRGRGGDAFEGGGEAYLRRIAEGFAEAARRLPELVRPVDASGPPEAVGERVFAAVADLAGLPEAEP